MPLKMNIRGCFRYSVLLGLLFLVGCGFHLRGTQFPHTLPFSQIYLSPIDDFNPLYKRLYFAFKRKKITVCPCKKPGIPYLKLLDYHFSYLPMAYNCESKVQSEKVLLNLTYQYHDTKCLTQRVINIRRFRQVNFNHKLADLREKERMEKEMINDVSEQILLQLIHPSYKSVLLCK